MMKRLFILGIGVSLIQVLVFYFFIFMVYWFSAAMTYPPSLESDGDYITLFAAIIFAIIVLVQNVIAAVINNKKATYVLVAFAVAFYTFVLIDMGFSIPFKTRFCMVFGIVVLVLKPKLTNNYIKW